MPAEYQPTYHSIETDTCCHVAVRLQVVSNLAEYGNTSAASIPLALDEAVRGGKVKPGDVVAMAGFGAGLTWAGAIVRWG